MFGIKSQINDGMLYLINDMVEIQLINAKKELSELSAGNTERREFLTAQIAYKESELEKFKTDIEKQLSEKFQFSIEELYAMYGQYDNKYINIEFHKFSKSAKKFGRNIDGVLSYYKKEREELEGAISKENVPRTNGMVKIDCPTNEKLTTKQITELIKVGFNSSDIYEVLASNYPAEKSFNQSGIKEIPNTISVNVDPKYFDANKAYIWTNSQKIIDGQILIEEELAKFCGFSLFLEPGSENFDLIKNNSFDKNGCKLPLVRFYELDAKLNANDISLNEMLEFNALLKARRIERTEAINNEIKKSTNKGLEHFKQEYPEIFAELQKSIVQFETESLEYHDLITPIYWDFEGYLHIYLRHCDEFAIEGHFENKTKFQYSKKDIKRILQIAIKKLKPQINVRLTSEKEFRVYGDRTLYFNGNHYSLHILSNGRVASFHPMENPNE
ncbi:hypothetical protein [Cyclobacterium amurskyense]|uniref:Uncharacterized protein n=1 Tax=Cyclobacterium amurskyense TaxID=320787 RepID=A0A0H4PEL2_9BACT|nr:hypothetical protein [Cyclobacterium amurskyense]AKP51535.1 hypothetical protein CA2015_2113 [Cyclobacterium amurskyense]